MKHYLPMFIARYWIAVAVLTFALLSAYTSHPIYGQAGVPTPDVNTVPPIELLQTPTNTPFPTPTPLVDSGQPGGDTELNPTATPFFNEPTATPPSTDNDSDSGGGSTGGGGSSTGGGSTGGGDGNSESSGGESDSSTENSPPSDSTSLETGLTGMVNAVTLNVRKGPSSADPIVDTLFRNEPVAILARNSSNSWWYICCGTGAGRAGWVSAALITPDFDRNQAETLLPITATSPDATTTDDDQVLLLEMRPNPAFVWQGQTVQLQFVVRNLGDQPLTKIHLRNDLPPTLTYLSTVAGQQGTVQESGEAKDGLIYAVSWPDLAAGETVTATVTLQLADNLTNGVLVDNLAIVDTAEGTSALAGITFAMPPVQLPRFR